MGEREGREREPSQPATEDRERRKRPQATEVVRWRDQGALGPVKNGPRQWGGLPAVPEKHATTKSPVKAPVAVPGSSQLERRLAELRAHVPLLNDAISAADPVRAIDASVEVTQQLATAQELAVASKRPEDQHALTEIQQVADAALREAPRPSIEAGAQALRGSWDLWDQEIGGWRAMHGAPSDAGTPAAIAASGTKGEGQQLPFQKEIQASFGHHDVSDVRAHVGGDAARSAGQLGASAFAIGKRVGFESAPALHTAAHEAAHTVQQQKGVQLKGGIDGGAGDPHEHHADAVADLVVAGRSAERLLDRSAGSATGGSTVAPSSATTVQRKSDGDAAPRPKPNLFGEYLRIHVARLSTAVVEKLAATQWPDPASDVPFGRTGVQKFREAFARSFLPHLSQGETLPQLLHPSDVLEHFVDQLHKRFPDLHHVDANEWRAEDPNFTSELAQAVERAAVESLMRLGPRYRAALIQRGHKPDADDLSVSHPMDPLVARALVEPGVVDDTKVATPDARAEKTPGQEQAHAQVHVKADWIGREHPELWNFVRVSPESATVEDVGIELWGSATGATMAIAITKFGDLFRIAPAHARKLIADRYRGQAVVGSGDPDSATQIMALARTDLAYGDAAPRQFKENQAGGAAPPTTPTPEQLAGLEKAIGGVLDSIHEQVAPVGMAAEIRLAYGARAARIGLLAAADAKTRTEWLPVLQFQHVQLMSIAPKIGPIVTKLASLKAPAPDAGKQQERDQLHVTLTTYMQAVAVSHLRDESTALLRSIAQHEHRGRQRAVDAAERDLEDGSRQAVNTPGGPDAGAAEAREHIANERQAVMTGRTEGHSPYDQQIAMTLAGEVALHSRMRASEHALTQLHAAAVDAFGSPEAMHKAFPNVKVYPEVIADVKAHLADVQRAWDDAAAKGVPTVQTDTHAPADWGKWQGREAGVAAARAAFAKIAGDKGLAEFFNEAHEKIRHQQFVSALVTLGATLLITIATGMGAAALGKAAAGALVGEAANLAEQAAALTVELAVNVPINSAVQLALADGHGSLGWAMLENTLMELLTRGIMGSLRQVQKGALAEARAFAALPHLGAAEQRALLSLDFAGTEVMAEVVGGAASNWTANRLVQLLRQNGDAMSEPFAYTVLQQGAAIGLGKYFHGQLHAWTQHRAALENTKFGKSTEALALYTARDDFFRQAAELENSLSPDPAAQDHLADLNTALLKKERALFGHTDSPHPLANEHPAANASATHEHSAQASHPSATHEAAAPDAAQHAVSTETTHPPESHPAPANVSTPPVVDIGLGAEIAGEVPGVRYEVGPVFKIKVGDHEISLSVRRTGDKSKIVREPTSVILDVPKGLSRAALKKEIVDRIAELHRHHGGDGSAYGTTTSTLTEQQRAVIERGTPEPSPTTNDGRPRLDEFERHAFQTPEQQDASRWQDHGIEEAAEAARKHPDKASAEEKNALALENDPEFRLWFGRWKSLPDRITVQPDGSYQAHLPSGVPEHIAAKLREVIPKTNILLTTRALAIREQVVRELPGASLDPTAPDWPATRKRLVEMFGEERAAKYEHSRTQLQHDPGRADVDKRINEVVAQHSLDQLSAMFPGVEIYITGSSSQPKKAGEPTSDVDIVAVVPEHTPQRVREEMERRMNALQLKRPPSEDPKLAGPPLPIDAKVMTPSEFAGMAMLETPAKRTPLNYARIDTPAIGPVPGTGASGGDLHAHMLGVTPASYFIDRIGGGDAVATLEKTLAAIHDPKLRGVKPELVPVTGGVLRQLENAIADVRNARDAGMPQEVVQVRAQRALDDVLAASKETPYDHTYDLRDLLIQAYIDPNGRFENFATDAITTLHDQGVTYSEQSVSLGKLQKRFTPEAMANAHARAGNRDSELKFLVMSPNDKTLASEKPSAVAKALRDQLMRPDVKGIDVAAPEAQPFTAAGMTWLVEQVQIAREVALVKGEAIVVRPHVGEGYPDASGEHVKVARHNLEMVITALEAAKYHQGEGVIVRFGHATHADSRQLARMAQLGVIVEANVGSNIATGSIVRAEDHPLLANMYFGVSTVLATDGQGVMDTTLPIEYQRAAALIEQFRSGNLTLDVGDKRVKFADLAERPEIQARFSIQWLTEQLAAYRARRSYACEGNPSWRVSCRLTTGSRFRAESIPSAFSPQKPSTSPSRARRGSDITAPSGRATTTSCSGAGWSSKRSKGTRRGPSSTCSRIFRRERCRSRHSRSRAIRSRTGSTGALWPRPANASNPTAGTSVLPLLTATARCVASRGRRLSRSPIGLGHGSLSRTSGSARFAVGTDGCFRGETTSRRSVGSS